MAEGPDLYSRLVAVLKVGLPLVALGLLAGLFLNPGGEAPRRRGCVFSDADLAALGSGMRVVAVDLQRHLARATTGSASPPRRWCRRGAAEAGDGDGAGGQVDFASGQRMDLSAATAELDLAAQVMQLRGTVRDRDRGRLPHGHRGAVEIGLQAGTITAPEPVAADGPMGRIDAGTMTIAPADATGELRWFSFGGGVRLVYDPPAKQGE